MIFSILWFLNCCYIAITRKTGCEKGQSCDLFLFFLLIAITLQTNFPIHRWVQHWVLLIIAYYSNPHRQQELL